MGLPIQVDKHAIAAFCKKRHIVKLAFFGSVLTEQFGPQSDVDVLVVFAPNHGTTLFDVVDMEDELTEMLGRKTVLRTPNDLSHLFRDEVLRNALVQYAA